MTTRLTVEVAPNSFEDIVALSALIRPGPMQMAPEFIARRHGRATTEYFHPLMEPILKDTWGVPLYQEQVMQIANVLAGFSMAESDALRKAMGKKLPAVMAEYRDRFVNGCVGNGIEKRLAGDVFDLIERFAGYGFPKSHSAAYGVITAQTAYLKANFPVQFMAALMSTEIGNTEKTAFNVAECRRAGIRLLPPDVNTSGVEYTVEVVEGKEAIRFGLGAVRNVGMGAVEGILRARDTCPDGRFASLEAFCDAIKWADLNKRAAECLVKAGALECFGERAAVLASLDPLIGAAQQRQKAAARGQMGLFGGALEAAPANAASQLANVPAADRKEMLAWEKETLGLYLSSHPLTDITGQGAPDGYVQVADLQDRPAGSRVSLIGMVVGVRRITTRNNRTMAVLEVEDLTGSIEVVAFPDTYEQHTALMDADQVLAIVAKLDDRGESRQLILEQATSELPTPRARPSTVPLVVVRIETSADLWSDINRMQAIDEALQRHEGQYQVEIELVTGRETHRLRSRTRRVEWGDALERELREITEGLSASLRDGGSRSEPARELQEVA
jgi:DNA polymerase-3 subunit alpha